jgi:hypothetical protein
LVYRSDIFFNEQVGKGLYNRNDLVEIKLPVNMPGITSWSSYEPIRGQVQFKDASYNYVKLKITRNAIYLMCVPNYQKTRLLDQNIISAKNIANIPVNKKSHVPFGKLNSPDKYSFPITLCKLSLPITINWGNNVSYHAQAVQRSVDTPDQPPRNC